MIVFARRLLRRPANDIEAVRGEVRWRLDLREGIDLSICLFGGFEVATLKRYPDWVKSGDTVLDIGANVGAHTLPLARLVGSTGRVIAFEPTAYAFGKLQANIALNPELAPRIESNQLMLVANDDAPLPGAIYSSWPLEKASDLHAEHHGRLKTTAGADKCTLDDFLRQHRTERVDFIKLDVDGNENDVLAGARETLARFKPTIMLELAPYVYDARPQRFDDMLLDLTRAGYELSEVVSGKRLPTDPAKVRMRIPTDGGINAIAVYRGDR